MSRILKASVGGGQRSCSAETPLDCRRTKSDLRYQLNSIKCVDRASIAGSSLLIARYKAAIDNTVEFDESEVDQSTTNI